MESELVSSAVPPPEGVRAARVGVGCEGGLRDRTSAPPDAGFTLGAIVSPAAPANSSESIVAPLPNLSASRSAPPNSFESSVAPACKSRAPPRVSAPVALEGGPPAFVGSASPQLAQNRLFAATSAPHAEQNIAPRFYHCHSQRLNSRTLRLSNPPHPAFSTCTAVPYANTSVTPCITSVAS